MAPQKRWSVAPPEPALRGRFSDALDIPPLIAQLLINRGHRTLEAARVQLAADSEPFHDPHLLKGLDRAMARLRAAVSRREALLIVGDYDVDGLTGTAMLATALRRSGAVVEIYIPNRLTEGYGLGDGALAAAKHLKAKVLVTIDCGTTAFVPIAALQRIGVDVIVLDHHTPFAHLPEAHVVVNPLQSGCAYPNKALASAGVVFKLMQAWHGGEPAQAESYLDLAALGTIADVMPLVGENRGIVREGLKLLGRRRRVGLRALMAAARLDSAELSPYHVGFIIGPRLNAAGRLGDSRRALQLLLTEDAAEAEQLAEALNVSNRERRRLEQDVLKQSLEHVERSVQFDRHRIMVVAGEGWHQGVLGIVASRLLDRFYRPALVLSLDGELAKGSGRSTRTFHLVKALKECESLLEAYGGHGAACGLTLRRDNLPAFREAINRVASDWLQPEDCVPQLDIDAMVPLQTLQLSLVEQMERLGPFGAGNPSPVLASERLRLRSAPQVIAGRHLKCWLTDGRTTMEAIGFGMAGERARLTAFEEFSCAYQPSARTWDGERSVQLELKDVRVATPA